jgi:hypothetical protein
LMDDAAERECVGRELLIDVVKRQT